MKLPNFRLYNTQATMSLLLGLLGVVCVAMLAYFVFRGYNSELKVIPYDDKQGLGRFRRQAVVGTTAVTFLIGVTAGLMGFSSLGQKRNAYQGRSWLGMATGAFTVAMAPILCYAWYQLSEPVIHEMF